MNEPLIYSATLAEKKDEVVAQIKQLFLEDREIAINMLTEIAFSPDTDNSIRRELAPMIGNTKSPQLFNMVLSHFILKTFNDPVFLIRAIGAFRNPKAIRSLIDFYTESDWEAREEIIKALSGIPVPETFEFFSQIFNDEIELKGEVDVAYQAKLKQKASAALSKQII